jgi:hypothetical protein
MSTPKDRTPRGAQTTRAVENVKPARPASRIEGAYFLGGTWCAADGSPLTSQESQQAHRAADAKAAEAKRKALLGGDR